MTRERDINWHLWRVVLIVLTIVLLAALVLLLATGKISCAPLGKIQVPDVVGKEFYEAISILEEDFHISGTLLYHESKPGTIIETNPLGGSTNYLGQGVHLYISLGPRGPRRIGKQ